MGFAELCILLGIPYGRLGTTAGQSPHFQTALEIPPEDHVRIQAPFPEHLDNAVSKTANLPPDATADDVARIFRLAHRLGCKGITVFWYGSKYEGMLELGVGGNDCGTRAFSQVRPGGLPSLSGRETSAGRFASR